MDILQILQNQFNFISFFGDKEFILTTILFICVVYFIFKNYLKEAALLILSTFSYPISLGLKFILRHQRPLTAGTKASIIDFYSFPSSHVLVYTVFFGYLLYLTFKIKKMDKLLKFTFRFMSSYLLTFVGASRIYLGEHWIKDIVGGYVIGLGLLLTIIFLDKKWKYPPAKNKK